MRTLTGTLAFLAFSVLFAGPAPGQGAGMHEDEALGYKVRFPQGWQKMPLAVQERWIVAKYLCDREYVDKESGWGFKPEMRVILFAHAVTEDRGVKSTEEGEGEEKRTTVEVKNPYKDYKDYLGQNYSGGGWFVSLEEEQKNGDLAWTLLEIKVEKLAYGGKKRIVTGVFHAADADFAVHFEVLEDSYAKLKPVLYGCLKSFALVARKGTLAPATTEGPGGDGEDEDKLTPEQRKQRREERQRKTYERAVAGLPSGWESFEACGFLVLSHVDRKYAMKVVKQAEAVRNWLDKTFAFMGDEYVRMPILRICANSDEERSYSDGSSDAWLSPAREIVTHKDAGAGALSYEFEWVNRRVVSGWFMDKDPDTASYMPDWLDSGLGQYLGTATLKGAVLEFKADDWEKERLREAAKKGDLLGVKAMLLAGWNDFKASPGSQGGALLRFMMEGPGRGMKESKGFVERYLKALREVSWEWEKKAEEERKKAEGSSAPEGPKTEDEEDEEYKNRGKRAKEWEQKRKDFLQEVLNRAFGGLTDADWEKIDRAYLASVS